MRDVLIENWYVIWSAVAAALLVAFLVWANRHPDSPVVAGWQRLKYAWAAAVVFGGIFLVIAMMFDLVPFEAMPYWFGVLLVVGWFAAPALRKWLPLERDET